MTVEMRVNKIRMVMQNLITKSHFFEVVMKEAKRQHYPGCSKFSRFSFVGKMLHMKSLYRRATSVCS
jgi:hypothetical protein